MIEDQEKKKKRRRGGEGSRKGVGGGRKRKREEAHWPHFASALIKATWSSPQTRLTTTGVTRYTPVAAR